MRIFLFCSTIIFLFLCISLGITFEHWGEFSGWHTAGDYTFHWSRANDICPFPLYPIETCQNYRPLYQALTRVFAGQEFLFNIFPILILVFFIPFLIYSKTKSCWSLLAYYSSAFIFHTLFSSIFAQMLLTIFFVLMLYFDKFNPVRDLTFFLFGTLSHSKAFYVLTPIILYKIFSKELDNHNSNKFKQFFFPTFSLANIPPDYLLFLANPISWFFSLKLSFSKNLLIFVFILGAFLQDYRSLLFLPILWSFWLPEILEKESTNKKYLWSIVYVFWIILQFLYFHFLTNPQVPIP